MPFTSRDEKGFPVPVLAQIDRKNFDICVPFKYRQSDEDEWVTVPKNERYRRTDLASVPGFLLWLVPRYGMHTLAALVHDQLVKDQPPGGRVEADTIFRNALAELKVPWIRRWVMWAAVSLGTVWVSGLAGKVRVAAWGLLTLIATAFFWQHTLATLTDLQPWSSWLVFGNGRRWDLAVVAAAGLAFTPRIGLGWLAGAAVLMVLVPTVAVVATTVIYLVLEWLARGLLWVYNRMIAAWVHAEPVDNVAAVMSMSEDTGAEDIRPGCPELAVEAAAPGAGG